MTAKMPALAALVFMAVKVSALIVFCWNAYKIRLHAIEEYGRVIHEFDPWFNYRATEVRAYHHPHGCREYVTLAPSRHQLRDLVLAAVSNRVL
jgi:asparagine N-glycosylation enzyme membrane subunit Stt3